ncbi:hypothetical protein [Methanoregula sp.]|uniref:hypothetical protein n=1 Tax=Methanoregula sp. TaxID=2052170 RepID=UPI00236E852F|nr:hypothetical protein [Methanoregula sp.]MDD1685655.1 hypothetical protein [Methanoregula sp.]
MVAKITWNGNLSRAGRGVILLVLVIGGIIAGVYLSGMYSASPLRDPDPGTAVPCSTNTASGPDYCIIMEYGETRAARANLIPLVEKDFRAFPEFTRWMNCSTGSVSWYNDARTVGDFIDCGGRFHAFLNLSCRNLSEEECASAPKKSPDLFVHDGRYYFVSCLPGFGMSGHPGSPVNSSSSCL